MSDFLQTNHKPSAPTLKTNQLHQVKKKLLILWNQIEHSNMTMKIVLVVLVACFAASHCQNELPEIPTLTPQQQQCFNEQVLGNQGLLACALMFGNVDPSNPQAVCDLSCIGDFAAAYGACNVSPNPVTRICPGVSGAASTVAVPMMVITGIVVTLSSLF